MFSRALSLRLLSALVLLSVSACENSGGENADSSSFDTPKECVAAEGDAPDSLPLLGCERDFLSVAAEPSDSSLPGALSVKFVIDRVDDSALYFQNSTTYPIHYLFASEHLSAVGDLPAVLDQESFNSNYYEQQRRFYLGSITHYEGPDKWVMEMAPYDTASPEALEEIYQTIAVATYFGNELYYHPTGTTAEAFAAELPDSVKTITTDELYQGIDYQPLTLRKSCGRLVFYSAAQLDTNYVSFQDIVVLDSVPNDISVAQGIITAEFQTPLSHVNVLSQNRGTPNMALRGAFDNQTLRALEGKWVTLDVGPHHYSIVESDAAASDECMVQPEPIDIADMDLSVTALTDIKDIYDPESDVALRDQISAAVPIFGGKASHFSPLAYIAEANAPKAFAVPVYFYHQFMVDNGFDLRVDEMLADATFTADPASRDEMLAALRDDMMLAPVNAELMSALLDKLAAEYAGIRMRFRSSTNAEDLGDFTGAGLYTSKSADQDEASIADALREVWSSIWYFRAFEERAYLRIDHRKVGMALLVHNSFPDEEANGVAVTANPFDSSGAEPAFYVNVQYGGESVVQPGMSYTTDQFIYYYQMQGQPTVYLEHSNLVPAGESVLTATQIHELGLALKAIHQFFFVAYGSSNGSGWYAMDTEFKFDGEPGEEPQLYIKQARPYPGR